MLRSDPGTLLALLVLLLIVGSLMTGSRERVRKFGIGLGCVALLAAAAWLWSRRPPRHAEAWMDLTVEALVICGFVVALSWIVGAVLVMVWSVTIDPLWSATNHALEEQRRRRELEEERERIEREREPLPAPCEPSPPLPPPSKEQLKEEAKQRYEARLQLLDTAGLDEIELKAARDAAKQAYLRDLDRVFQ